jgi:oligopeptide transport system permease protein
MARDRGLMFSAGGLLILIAAAIAGPWLSPYSEAGLDLSLFNAAPGAAHWMGCDSLGRDLLTRVLYGGRISLAVGAMGALISIALGVSIGGLAGMAGGWIETAVLRLIDFLYGVPLLLVVIGLMVATGRGLSNVFIALGLVFWLQMARVVRARVAELRRREFVDGARALGAGRLRIFLKHVLPNAAGAIIVTATFVIPEAIFAESFLSFLGLGVVEPHSSWGALAADGLESMRSAPHVLAFPAAAICLTMFLFQSLGESLRAALDPRSGDSD